MSLASPSPEVFLMLLLQTNDSMSAKARTKCCHCWAKLLSLREEWVRARAGSPLTFRQASPVDSHLCCRDLEEFPACLPHCLPDFSLHVLTHLLDQRETFPFGFKRTVQRKWRNLFRRACPTPSVWPLHTLWEQRQSWKHGCPPAPATKPWVVGENSQFWGNCCPYRLAAAEYRTETWNRTGAMQRLPVQPTPTLLLSWRVGKAAAPLSHATHTRQSGSWWRCQTNRSYTEGKVTFGCRTTPVPPPSKDCPQAPGQVYHRQQCWRVKKSLSPLIFPFLLWTWTGDSTATFMGQCSFPVNKRCPRNQT